MVNLIFPFNLSFRLSPLRYLPAISTLFLALHPSVSHAAGPDPLALLRGVEDSRLSIPSGRVELSVDHIDHTLPNSGVFHEALEIVFAGEKRRFDEHSNIIVVDGMRPGASDADKKLKSLGGDREAFVKEGLGTLKQVHTRSAFDGTQFMQYNEEMGAYIRDPSKGSSNYAFDPRVLGITVWFMLSDNVTTDLGYRDAKSVSLIGEEALDGHRTRHVRVLDLHDRERHFWIDPQDFRVYKMMLNSQFQHEISSSDYDVASAFRSLPSRVKHQSLGPDGRIQRETTYTVLRAKVGHVDPKSWTLAGLGMPLGEMVIDQRIHRVVGHFDGQGLTANMPEAIRKGREARLKPLHWGMALTGLIALTVLAAWLIRRKNLLGEGVA